MDERGNGQEDSREPRPEKGDGKRKSPGTWPDGEAMRDVVFKKAGIVSQVAEAIGMDRRTIQKRMERDEEFRGWFEEARELRLDLSESVIFRQVASGNLTAAIFHLKCQGKSRGWIERQELTGADGRDLFAIEARKLADGVREALEDEVLRAHAAALQGEINARMAERANGDATGDEPMTKH